jgi:hypothetical protein
MTMAGTAAIFVTVQQWTSQLWIDMGHPFNIILKISSAFRVMMRHEKKM